MERAGVAVWCALCVWVLGMSGVQAQTRYHASKREADDALVIAAGIPAGWLEGEGVAIDGLRTPQGQLAYTLKASNGVLRLDVPAGLTLPKGGLVLSLPEPWASGRLQGGERIERGELLIDRLPARIEITRQR